MFTKKSNCYISQATELHISLLLATTEVKCTALEAKPPSTETTMLPTVDFLCPYLNLNERLKPVFKHLKTAFNYFRLLQHKASYRECLFRISESVPRENLTLHFCFYTFTYYTLKVIKIQRQFHETVAHQFILLIRNVIFFN